VTVVYPGGPHGLYVSHREWYEVVNADGEILEVDALTPAAVPAFASYSRFPSIRRDLAIVVAEDVSAEALTKVARAAAGDILQQVIVFDVYRGEGVDSRQKSIGLGLILQDSSRTLTDEDADQEMRSVMQMLERELGATIRT